MSSAPIQTVYGTEVASKVRLWTPRGTVTAGDGMRSSRAARKRRSSILTGWKSVIEKVLGHPTFYLYAESANGIEGVLPLAHVRSYLFGNALVSTPFCVYGGVAAKTEEARRALEDEAERLAVSLGVDHLEMRNRTVRRSDWPTKDLYVTLPEGDPSGSRGEPERDSAEAAGDGQEGNRGRSRERDRRRRRPVLRGLLPRASAISERRSFRSATSEALKEEFGESCEVLTVTNAGKVVSSVLSFYFRDEVLPYYGGGPAEARELKANDFMYWELMRRSAERGIRVFDYGRSKVGSGSYSFKKNWGFEPEPLPYQYRLVKAQSVPNVSPNNPEVPADDRGLAASPARRCQPARTRPREESGLMTSETPLLFLVHRIPYPPNKGDKIRSYHMLRFLAERYRVHLGTFVDHDDDWRYVPELEKLCADVCAVRLNPRRQRLFSLKGLFGGEPLSVPYYESSELRAWVRRKVYEEGITRMVFFSSPMAQYAPSNGVAVRKVVDFVDVDSEKWRQYAERHRWPMSWLYRREGERLLDFERAVASSADASVFVTQEEADLFRRRARFEDERVRSVVQRRRHGVLLPGARSFEIPMDRAGRSSSSRG